MGKVQWVRRYLPQLEKRMILTRDKSLCAAPGRLLVDDYHRNIDAWRAQGGTGFLWPAHHNRKSRDQEVADPDHILMGLEYEMRGLRP